MVNLINTQQASNQAHSWGFISNIHKAPKHSNFKRATKAIQAPNIPPNSSEHKPHPRARLPKYNSRRKHLPRRPNRPNRSLPREDQNLQNHNRLRTSKVTIRTIRPLTIASTKATVAILIPIIANFAMFSFH